MYKVAHIARDVRVAMDENRTGEQLITDEDVDTLSLNDIILTAYCRSRCGNSWPWLKS